MVYWHSMFISYQIPNSLFIKIVDSEGRYISGRGNWGCCSDICPRDYAGNFLEFITSEARDFKWKYTFVYPFLSLTLFRHNLGNK